ncbi:hypothetical protein ACFV8E_33405, partial [Streptomyces sp. NPDC059849]|uniref:hypothetical protein n=1 Tax=Streptomyces sp. NPDC059849 TaxID=3346969 RepID=UPI0036685D3F
CGPSGRTTTHRTTYLEAIVIFGGFSTTGEVRLRPENAEYISTDSSVWRIGHSPARCVTAGHGHRRFVVLGECGATDLELGRLPEAELPADIT